MSTSMNVQRVVVEGKRYVLIRESRYEQLCREAKRMMDLSEDELPALPRPDKNGNYPAIEYSRVSLARDLIRQRRALGLSQQELARHAGVRQETISRIETGKHSVTVKTYDKLFGAMESLHEQRGGRSGRRRNGRGG